MPNWITNNIEGPKSVLKKYINKDGEFDFNLIAKMPESLKLTAGTVEEHAIVAYLTNKTLNVDKITKKTDKALLKKLVKNEFAGPTWPKQIAKDVKEKSKEEIENLYKNASTNKTIRKVSQKAVKSLASRMNGYFLFLFYGII